ncbi:MAG TPA: amylo-alpha-1,6-glucosidase, partial [Candidatus Elarobacter sp.]|nr:amylo-alpha-1,6-glucosidase [Candidatus Elarobacter sp.]
VEPGRAATALYWRLHEGPGGTLAVRPLVSGRDYHALHHENPAFRFDAEVADGRVVWRPYPGLPAIVARANGAYAHQPDWYRSFLYTEERDRGLDCVEDLASPGIFRWDLARGGAVLVLAAEGHEPAEDLTAVRAAEEGRRRRFPSRLHRAADAYLVRRGSGKTIVAGYPWFTDWGRDTFIAMRGLCLATGRLDDARAILLEWAGAVSEGMLPNRFPDRGEAPEFNAVDAALWYVVAVHDFLEAAPQVPPRDRQTLAGAVEAILAGYVAGTRYRIHVDGDGLLAAGEPGVQLTWMDAKVGDWVVTPRIGKPVEVQALWLNALRIGSELSERWAELHARARPAFAARFWDEARGHLADVVDVDHRPGTVDATFRPNQILAVGGLPFAVLEGERARRIVDAVEARLVTPLGLRSLAPGEPGYTPRYAGGPRERDGAYHQGTVWPWLMGGFVEAWVRVRGGTPAARAEARARFLDPLLAHLSDAGLGHLPEIADGDPPHTPRGCPFQAWSVGEALRLTRLLA